MRHIPQTREDDLYLCINGNLWATYRQSDGSYASVQYTDPVLIDEVLQVVRLPKRGSVIRIN